jgi:hypothetical protein
MDNLGNLLFFMDTIEYNDIALWFQYYFSYVQCYVLHKIGHDINDHDWSVQSVNFHCITSTPDYMSCQLEQLYHYDAGNTDLFVILVHCRWRNKT